jgi:hypothetical protein
VTASIAALEQVAGSLGLDLDKFVKRIQSTNDGETKRIPKGSDT